MADKQKIRVAKSGFIRSFGNSSFAKSNTKAITIFGSNSGDFFTHSIAFSEKSKPTNFFIPGYYC